MKNSLIILGLISLLASGRAFAQVENDDMYFNSKDRAKLRAARGQENTYASADERDNEEESNPSDSYSARNVNPEYTSRANSKVSESDNEDYFVYDYHYAQQSQFNNFNNNYNNWYSSSWYSPNYWGPSINGWNSPYYGSAYDRWGNPWANPYYRSGWSSSFSYFWGNSYNYGWGMNMGYGNPYYNSWGYNNMWGGYGYNPYSPYMGAYNPYYGGYPGNIVVVDNNYRAPVYGKRSSRSAQLNREYNNRSSRMRVSNYDQGNDNGNDPNNGRVRSTNNRRTYTSPNTTSQSAQPSNNDTRSSWESQKRSSWSNGNSNSGGFERSSTPTRSSSTSGSGSSSGGSGSRSSRGRN